MSIQQILCLCVLVLMYALIISGKYTIAIPASVGAIAMVMIGVLDLKSLFTQYCSDTIAIMLGMMILGKALFECGIVDCFSKRLVRFSKDSETVCLLAIFVFASVMSVFMGTTPLFFASLPMLVGISRDSKISMWKMIFVFSIGSDCGQQVMVIGANTNLVASNVLEELGFGPLGFFELSPFSIVSFVLTVPFIIFIVKRLLPDRQFLPEVGTQASEQIPVPVVKKRMLVVAIVFVVAIALTILDLKVLPKEIVPCAAALLLMLLGYVDIKPALASVDWSILLMVAGMTAVAKGIQKSGLIELIIHNVIQDISGMNLILVALIIYGMSGILTQFVTNSALSAMLLPLVIPFSASIGLSTHMAAAAVSIGCNLHPITYMAQARAAALKEYSGITMKEFVKIGLAYWVVSILSFILCIPYFMGQ